MFSSVRTEGRSESFAGQQLKRKKERERGEEKRIIFWVGVMDWMIYNLGYKGKSQEGVDRTVNLDTVLCQHHETVDPRPPSKGIGRPPNPIWKPSRILKTGTLLYITLIY